jgi:hypothetical protein
MPRGRAGYSATAQPARSKLCDDPRALEVAQKKLRATLREEEARQVTAWLKEQHRCVERDLDAIAKRLTNGGAVSPLPAKRVGGVPITTALRVEGSALREPMLEFRGRLSLRCSSSPERTASASPNRLEHNDASSRARGRSNPLCDKIAAAVRAQGLRAADVRDFLLPPGIMEPGETVIRVREVAAVLSLDLHTALSPEEEAEVVRRFRPLSASVSDDLVDVRALLDACDLWDDSTAVQQQQQQHTLQQSPLTRQRRSLSPSEQQQRPRAWHDDYAATAAVHGRTHTPSPSPPRTAPSPHVLPSYAERRREADTASAAAQAAAVAERAREHERAAVRIQALHRGRAQRLRYSSRRTSTTASSSSYGDRHSSYVAAHTATAAASTTAAGAAAATALPTAAGTATADAVAAENARLRAELDTFDLGFFEEIEDLKYAYASLRRAAAGSSTPRGGRAGGRSTADIAAQLGLPPAGEESWSHSVEAAQRSIDWDAAAASASTIANGGTGRASRSTSPVRGAHAERLRRQWEGSAAGSGSSPLLSSSAFFGSSSTAGASPLQTSARKRQRRRSSSNSAAAGGSGVVGAHERKLAWEVSSGGMECLLALRQWVGRMDHDGNGFLAGGQLAGALSEAGYALDTQDVEVRAEQWQ